MRSVIFGFDDFGEKVAKALGKRVSIVVFNEEEEKRAKNKLYDVIRFDEISEDSLKELDYSMAIALLREEDKNLFLCLSLKDLFPEKKLIAKVSEKGNEYKYKLAGVDKIINPYDVAANRIMTILKKPTTLKLLEEIIFQDNNFSFAEIEVPENSFLDGKYINDVYRDISNIYNILIVAIVDKEVSDNVQFITKGVNHKIDRGDILVVVGDKEDIERFKEDLESFKGIVDD